MQDQVGLDGFPLDHEFPRTVALKRGMMTWTAVGEKPKRKSKRTKAYTPAEDNLLCECWRDIQQDPKVGAEQKWSA